MGYDAIVGFVASGMMAHFFKSWMLDVGYRDRWEYGRTYDDDDDDDDDRGGEKDGRSSISYPFPIFFFSLVLEGTFWWCCCF